MVITPEQIAEARRILGRQLANLRRAAGYTQHQFASLRGPAAGYSRSQIANVETGRGSMPRSFWERFDRELGAAGALLASHEQVNDLIRQHRREVAWREHGRAEVARLQAGHVSERGPAPGIAKAGSDLAGARDTLAMDPQDDPGIGFLVREIAMAAEESARFTRRAGVAVNAEFLDQIRSEVHALAVDYLRRPPYAVVAPLGALRREVFSILDRHVPAHYLADLYLYAGQLTALLAHASADLGQAGVAEAHARAAWLCAELAGHDPLRAYVRWVQANIAYWAGQHRQAAEIAAIGRSHTTTGSSLLRLASQEARAWAACGDQRAVEHALSVAAGERDRLTGEPGDEVGVFHFAAGKAAYYAAEARLAVGGTDNARRALHDAGEALSLLTTEPEPCAELVSAARLDLATAQLTLGQLDAVEAQITSVLELPAERRTVPVAQRVAKIHDWLSGSAAVSSSIATGLRERTELFLAYPATRELTS